MTVMQAMQKQIASDMNQLGGQTFKVSKWPEIFLGGRGWFEKYLRRKELTLARGRLVASRATLARSVGLGTDFNDVEVSSRQEEAVPSVGLSGDTAGSFDSQNWTMQDGRGISDAAVE